MEKIEINKTDFEIMRRQAEIASLLDAIEYARRRIPELRKEIAEYVQIREAEKQTVEVAE